MTLENITKTTTISKITSSKSLISLKSAIKEGGEGSLMVFKNQMYKNFLFYFGGKMARS